jgi:hypothetical protein
VVVVVADEEVEAEVEAVVAVEEEQQQQTLPAVDPNTLETHIHVLIVSFQGLSLLLPIQKMKKMMSTMVVLVV